uniref:Uncharacterized protein n=1 Tax=viral metagenome TaxID=1070528 RepID=A0A6H1ZQ91_9ZZZZ
MADRDAIRACLLPKSLLVDEVVHGGCPQGIDALVNEVAKELGFTVKVFRPKIEGDGRYYLKRNREMAKYSDMLYAFPFSKNGKAIRGGTEHTIRQFEILGKPVIIFNRRAME